MLLECTVGRVLIAQFNKCEPGISNYIANQINAYWLCEVSHTPLVQALASRLDARVLKHANTASCLASQRGRSNSHVKASQLYPLLDFFSLEHFRLGRRTAILYFRFLTRRLPFFCGYKTDRSISRSSYTVSEGCVCLTAGSFVDI